MDDGWMGDGWMDDGSGLHITSKSLANASKIFRWRVMDANYLPAGEYIKIPDIFQKL